jgi:hypothetical protein
MPRLGSFLICEKIIVDQQQKPTLISIFQSIAALVPEEQQLPKDIIGGAQWAIFCEWFFAEEELNKNFEQVVEVLLPDGSPSPIRGRLSFRDLAKDGQGTRTYVNMFGMPISQVGFLSINVWIESNTERVTDIFTYRIKIEHTKQPPTPHDGGTLIPTLSQTKPI